MAAAFFMRGEARSCSRYSSSESLPSRSVSPKAKIRSGSKGWNSLGRCLTRQEQHEHEDRGAGRGMSAHGRFENVSRSEGDLFSAAALH